MTAPALATPIRGLRMMTVAVVLMMLRFVLELVLAVWALGSESDGFHGIAAVLTWSARLRLIDLTAVTLLVVGVASNLGELRRRRLSVTGGVIALVTFAITFAVHAWMYDLLSGLAAAFGGNGRVLDRITDLERVPTRTFLGTVAYLAGLSATVRMIRAYAITDGNLGLREQARAIAGMLILLLIADTFYRFSYGLGGGQPMFGVVGLAAAIGLGAFWFWCHRRLGHLFDTAKYYLRTTAELPIAVAMQAAPIAAPPIAPPTKAPLPIATLSKATPPKATPPIAVAPIVPLPAAAPVKHPDESAPPAGDGPRFLR